MKAKTWEEMRAWQIDLLQRSTDKGLDTWNERIRSKGSTTEQELRRWLDGEGVRGYAQMLLVHETFGYPDFLTKGADQLLDEQYADREELRPVFDTIVAHAAALGELDVSVRKTYVSLVGPRRTFAVVKPTTRTRVDLGLRLPDASPGGRLLPAKSLANDTINVRFGLSHVDDVDDEVVAHLQRAYEANL